MTGDCHVRFCESRGAQSPRPLTKPQSERPKHAAQGQGKAPGKGKAAAKPSSPQVSSAGGAAQFHSKGGDNSIQEFGGEGKGSELAQAAAALHAYLDARANEEWVAACRQMAADLTRSLKRWFATSHQAPAKQGKHAPKHVGCPQILAALTAGIPAYVRREMTRAEAGALRVQGAHAFLLFHGARHTDYFMPMAKEGGRWKVSAVAASVLP